MNQNIVMLVGRIANKPQLKTYTKKDKSEGYRCFFRLAVTRLMDRGVKREDQRCSFIPIVAWGEAAKRHAQYLDVGTEVTIAGELIVDANRNEDGTFAADFFNVQARDIQYGQPSLKNATLETVQRRQKTLTDRIEEIQAGMATGSEVPAGAVAPGVNPFTKDGEAPVA